MASTPLQYKYIVCMIVVQCDNMFLFDYRPSFTTVVKSDLIYFIHLEKSRALGVLPSRHRTISGSHLDLYQEGSTLHHVFCDCSTTWQKS